VSENGRWPRVVVTGIGAVTPIGLDAASFRAALYEGRSGVTPITQFDAEVPDPATGEPQFTTRIAAEVRGFEPRTLLKKPHRYDRASQLALAAAGMALADAGLRHESPDTAEMGVVLGTGGGDSASFTESADVLRRRGARRISPLALPRYLASSLPANVAIHLGAHGPNLGISTACASGAHAVGEAFWIIRRGDTDRVLAGGAEAAITPLAMAGFAAMRVLSRRNHDPEGASRPFDAGRDGFVMGEGAAMLLLESLDSARARRAPIRAEVLGYGLSADAYSATHLRPDGAECARAMRRALQVAGLAPEAVDFVNAHGTATPQNDATETQAVKAVLRDRAREVPINATKSMIGHLMSAGAAAEILATVFALEDQRVHPTRNLERPDPRCDLDYVAGAARRAPIRVAMKNSFGLGGHNAVLLLRRWEG